MKTCLPEEINHPETLLKEKQILITSAFNCPLDEQIFFSYKNDQMKFLHL